MKEKPPVPFSQRLPNADPLALRLLERLLAFDPRDRPSAEEIRINPYFSSLANLEDEPSTKPISKLEFDFERRKLTKDAVRELIYREILEYHPQMLQEYLNGVDRTSFMYPRERVCSDIDEAFDENSDCTTAAIAHVSLWSPTSSQAMQEPETAGKDVVAKQNGPIKSSCGPLKNSGNNFRAKWKGGKLIIAGAGSVSENGRIKL
ncbi:MAP kinase 9 [Actinidia rufa]|uniref:MAP kinase 9 n=1 Tax=Actinidia rufa TaxID=165716 RepID=A0A7J0FCN5_9ERIC|nr:MAP kinase 9 [Actinidia rufa]